MFKDLMPIDISVKMVNLSQNVRKHAQENFNQQLVKIVCMKLDIALKS